MLFRVSLSCYHYLNLALHIFTSRKPLLEVAREQPAKLVHSLLLPASGSSHATSKLHSALKVLSSNKILVLLLAQLVEHSADEALCVLGVGLHVAHDHLDGHALLG